MTELLASPWFDWVILPALIFLARILDVSIGTIRIIFLGRGMRNLAPVLGFFEVLIWITAISQIMRNLDNPISYVAYAAGFAAGNYVGMTIEHRLALGMLAVRIFVTDQGKELAERLHAAGYGVTRVPGIGSTGEVEVLDTIIQRKCLDQVTEIVRSINPKTFYLVEEVRSANEGIFPPGRRSVQLWRDVRKRK